MQLATLLERLKMEHLQAQLDPVCEQASKADLDYKAFLAQALDVEWRGRYQHGVENRLILGAAGGVCGMTGCRRSSPARRRSH